MKIGKKRIITHRGLQPSADNFFSESSFEAFQTHLKNGYAGIEFDPNPTKDGFIILHDANLNRLSLGTDSRNITSITTTEASEVKLPNGRVPTFSDVMRLIRTSQSTMNALHLKSRLQSQEMIKLMIDELYRYQDVFNKLLIFDAKKETIKILKNKYPTIRIAPSIAHPYDIKRYNKFVGGTLMTIDEALELKKDGLIDGVWADEWDTQGSLDNSKKFYTKESFDKLHKVGLFIVVVSPELHGTSPGLYGGESHIDSRTKETLFARITEIASLGADYFCTDFPEEVAAL